MDEGTIKTQNPKCRLYWCLIEFIDWRFSQSCSYFRVVDHILQGFKTLFLTRFRTYKVAAVKTTFRDWCLFRPCRRETIFMAKMKYVILIDSLGSRVTRDCVPVFF